MNGSSRNSPREKRNEKLARGFVRAWIEFKWTLIIAAFSPPSFWFDIENLRLYVIVRYKIRKRESYCRKIANEGYQIFVFIYKIYLFTRVLSRKNTEGHNNRMREYKRREYRIIRGWIYPVLAGGQWVRCVYNGKAAIHHGHRFAVLSTDHCGQRTVLRDNTWRATPTYTIRIRRTGGGGGGVSRGMPHGCPWHALQIAGRFMGESGRPVAQFPYLLPRNRPWRSVFP